jgi:hypothetical protein
VNPREIQKWRSFEYRGLTYDLSHLDAKTVTYENPKTGKNYTFLVTFGLHCFAKDAAELTQAEYQELLYASPREDRPFHFERYRCSKILPSVIDKLHQAFIFDAGYENYATIEILTEEIRIDYKIVFVVFREHKKFRLHVSSAYPDASAGKKKKIGFFTIAEKLSKNQPLPRNQ